MSEDNKIDVLNPGVEFSDWNKIAGRHIRVMPGHNRMEETDVLLFSDSLEKHGCLMGDEIKTFNETNHRLVGAGQEKELKEPEPQKRGTDDPSIASEVKDNKLDESLTDTKKKSKGRPRKNDGMYDPNGDNLPDDGTHVPVVNEGWSQDQVDGEPSGMVNAEEAEKLEHEKDLTQDSPRDENGNPVE